MFIESLLCSVHFDHHMAFIRGQKRKTKSGVRIYYYLVENQRVDGKVRQKVLKYLGTNPNKMTVDLTSEQATAILGNSILSEAASDELKGNLWEMGIRVPEGPIEKVVLSIDIQKKLYSPLLT